MLSYIERINVKILAQIVSYFHLLNSYCFHSLLVIAAGLVKSCFYWHGIFQMECEFVIHLFSYIILLADHSYFQNFNAFFYSILKYLLIIFLSFQVYDHFYDLRILILKNLFLADNHYDLLRIKNFHPLKWPLFFIQFAFLNIYSCSMYCLVHSSILSWFAWLGLLILYYHFMSLLL